MILNIKDTLQPLLPAGAKSGLSVAFAGCPIATWEPGLGQFFQTWNCTLCAAVHDQVCLPVSYLPFQFIFTLAAQAFHCGTSVRGRTFSLGVCSLVAETLLFLSSLQVNRGGGGSLSSLSR